MLIFNVANNLKEFFIFSNSDQFVHDGATGAASVRAAPASEHDESSDRLSSVGIMPYCPSMTKSPSTSPLHVQTCLAPRVKYVATRVF
jgi:hypothetical protein